MTSASSAVVGEVGGPAIEHVLLEPTDWVEEVGKVRVETTKFGMQFFSKDLSPDEPDDGPWARQVIFPAGFENNPHFHSAPQFQVMLEGGVSFPTHELTAPAVHYADAFSPYGPFTCGEGFKIMVVRPWRAKKFNMSVRETRHLRNPEGRNMYGQSRELYGQMNNDAWQTIAEGVEAQQLLGKPTPDGLSGPMAQLVRLAPGVSIDNDPVMTEYGMFVIVFDGEISLRDTVIRPYSSFFARGVYDAPLVAGAAGALVLRLAFDEAAHLANIPDLAALQPS